MIRVITNSCFINVRNSLITLSYFTIGILWMICGYALSFGKSVAGGVMTNKTPCADIISEQKFTDFKAHIEFQAPKNGNSGIYLRGTPQVQIWDSTEKEKFNLGADKGSGGLWNNQPATSPGRSAGTSRRCAGSCWCSVSASRCFCICGRDFWTKNELPDHARDSRFAREEN